MKKRTKVWGHTEFSKTRKYKTTEYSHREVEGYTMGDRYGRQFHKKTYYPSENQARRGAMEVLKKHGLEHLLNKKA